MNEALYYSDVHRKLENQISADVIYLSSVLDAEGFKYEKQRLTESKRMITVWSVLGMTLLALFFLRYYYLQKETEKRFRVMVAPSGFSGGTSGAGTQRRAGRFTLPQEVYDKMREKLQHFEDMEYYLEADLTEKTVADRLCQHAVSLSLYQYQQGCEFPDLPQ